MTVGITRHELGAGDLRREARRCRDGAASRRMLALALVLEGSSREEAARHAGMDRQTLRDWVHRYNAEGLAGLRDRPRSGRKPRLTPEQEAELATAGLPLPCEDHAAAMAELALGMLDALERQNATVRRPFRARIGMHTGPVVAGIIGRHKFTYDV
jgi:class 3 adenylate cyclase